MCGIGKRVLGINIVLDSMLFCYEFWSEPSDIWHLLFWGWVRSQEISGRNNHYLYYCHVDA